MKISLPLFFIIKVMYYIKSFLLFTFLIACSGFINQNKPQLVKWVIYKEGSLRVNGSTNVNKFDCVISSYTKPDTLTFVKNNTSEAIKMSGSIKLNIASFDCHHPMMTADLRKTLKAKEYPKLHISFLSINKYPDLKQQSLKGWVSIALAGVTKRFEVDYHLKPDDANTIILTGKRAINFSDFNIIPPRKLGGMIQTNNELAIEFSLRMKVLNQ